MPTTPKTTKTRKPIAPVVELTPLDAAIVEEDIITFKRSHFLIALSVLTFAVGILLGYVLWGTDLLSGLGSDPQTANQPAVVNEAPQVVRYDIPSEGYPAFGPEDAPITIVEFSDFQCPFCKRWHDEVRAPLLEAYPGKIRLVYRHLPLTTIHPDAMSAAEAAMCANEQNAFWEFHDQLFGGELLGTGVYSQYAGALDLDVTAFDTCMNDHKYQQAIQADSDFAINLGVNSTPTFFVNGLAIIGAQPLEVFKQVIDKELAGEFPE